VLIYFPPYLNKQSSKHFHPLNKLYGRFIDVKLFHLFEDLPTNGQYSDIVLLDKANEGVCASFDPFGNTGQAHTQDNWIIEAKSVSIIEINTLDIS
jgi:hypothetical protein